MIIFFNSKYNILEPKPSEDVACGPVAPNDGVLNANDGAADDAPNPPPSCVPRVPPPLLKPPNAEAKMKRLTMIYFRSFH